MIGKTKYTRRDFVKRTAVAGAGLALLSKYAVPTAKAVNTSPGLQKWIQPLRGLNYPAGHILGALGYPNDPTGIPVAGGVADPVFANTTMYQLIAQEYADQLHPALGPTRLWGYGSLDVAPGTAPVMRHLGGLIVTTRKQAARLRFTNSLPSRHILPVDMTIPGANVHQNRMAIHLHGGWIPWISDGGPFDWWTSACDYASGLSFLNGPGGPLDNIPGFMMTPGQADYYYPNDQSTRLMWYHDHAWGITRLNAYAGLATGYLVVDLANDAARLTTNVPPYSSLIPLVWQEKSFCNPATTALSDPLWSSVTRPDAQTLGSLWYEHTYNPKLFALGKGLPVSDPSVIPEFFGDTMLCNGTVYPLLTVDPKAYRFMFLNATNARFFNINTFVADKTADGITLDLVAASLTYLYPKNPAGPVIRQFGSEGGYLAKEVVFTTAASPSALTKFNPKTLTGNLIMGPAERADVVIDFSGFAGQDIIIYNDAPAPYPGGAPTNEYYVGNPRNPVIPQPGFGPDTRQLLRIRVNATAPAPANNGPMLQANMLLDPPALATLPTALPATLTPQTAVPVLTAPAGTPVRPLTLNEAMDAYGRLIQLLGTTTPVAAGGFGRAYTDPATEIVKAGTMEVWQIFNTTADTHPMHFHLVNAQVLSRQPFKLTGGVPTPSGVAVGPYPNELGWKETIKMNPGEITNILMKFDLAANPALIAGGTLPIPTSPRTGGHEYVWHCHILEHEEHDMMRPLVVT